MRITKRTNIAMRVLMYCAAHKDQLVTKAQIAECCNASENHLAQVINQLSQLGFLRTQRGRHGGMVLAKAPCDIRVGDVFRKVEVAVPVAECFADADNSCPLIEACRLRVVLVDAVEAFYARLDQVTLDMLMCHNPLLLSLLQPAACSQSAKARVERGLPEEFAHHSMPT